MSFQIILAVSVTFAGFLLVALRSFLLRGVKINYRAFNAAMLKLVKADNVDRALKLCAVVPRCSYARAMAAGLLASQRREDARGFEVQDAARAAFDKELQAQLQTFFAPAMIGGLGVAMLLCGVGYALAYQVPVPEYMYGVAGLGGAAFLFSLNVPRGVKRSRILFAEVAAALAKRAEEKREGQNN